MEKIRVESCEFARFAFLLNNALRHDITHG